MGEEKKYTLKELKDKLTEKECIFCHEYIVDWNKARAARVAGYSETSARQIGYDTYTKAYIQQYIDFIKEDYEKESGITKLRNLKELAKIAYSSIAHLHLTWIDLVDFEQLTEDQKACIESTETKIEERSNYDPMAKEKVIVEVKMVKIKLYPKLGAIQEINKMQGYYAADKIDHSSTDGTMKPIVGITFDK